MRLKTGPKPEPKPSPSPTPSPTPSPNGGDGGGDTGGGDQSLEIDDAEEVVTSDGLQLSKNILKFASADKEAQLIHIENTSSNSLNWSVTTEHEAGLLEIQQVDISTLTGEGWERIQKKRHRNHQRHTEQQGQARAAG